MFRTLFAKIAITAAAAALAAIGANTSLDDTVRTEPSTTVAVSDPWD